MSKTTEIHSLAGIQQRKAELQREVELSRKAAIDQFQETAVDAKDFFLHDVLIPVAGITVGVFVVSKIVKSVLSSKPKPVEQASESASVAVQQQPVTQTVVQPAVVPPVPMRPVPAYTSRPPAPPTKPAKKSALVSLGALLIPAGKAIFSAIQEANQR